MVNEKDSVFQLKEVLGFQLSVSGNIDFCGHNTIFYLASNHGVLHNLKRNTQKFIPLRLENEVTAMSLGANSNVAVALKGPDPVVVIINLKTQIKHYLPVSGVKSDSFVHIAFTEDKERLGAQGSGPDWAFLLWEWERNILQCLFLPFRVELGAQVLQFSFWGHSCQQAVVVGRSFLRFYRLQEEQRLQETALHEWERAGLAFPAARWTRHRRALVATSDGRVLVFEAGLLQRQVAVADELERITARAVDPNDRSVSCILLTGDGIVCSCGHTSVLYFKTNFQLEKVYQIPESSEESGVLQLAMNKEKDRMVAATKDGRILTLSEDISKSKMCDAQFQVVQPYQHTERVTCVSTSTLVSLQASCSPSCFILRDLATKQSVLREKLGMVPVSVALHPLGTSVAIGFRDCATVYTVLVNRLFRAHHFDSLENPEVSFSPGGHSIVVTSGSTVSLFYSIGFKKLFSGNLHKSKVICAAWRDDSALVTSDADGVLVQWDVAQQRSAWVYCVLGGTVTCLAMDDAGALYVAGTDCRVRKVKDGTWSSETIQTRSPVTAMAMAERVLVVGTERGRVLGLFLAPYTVAFEYECHMGKVLHMTLLSDSVTVVSVGVDAKIATWRPEGSDDRALLSRCQQVLVSIQEQEELVKEIQELERELREMEHATEEGRKRDREDHSREQTQVEQEQEDIRASLQNSSNALREELNEIIATAKRNFEAEKADILAEIDNNENDFEEKMAKERNNMRRAAEERRKMEKELELKTSKMLEQRKRDLATVRERCSHHQVKLEELEKALQKELETQREVDAEEASIVIPERQDAGDNGASPEYATKRREYVEKIKSLEKELEVEKGRCKELDAKLKEKEEQLSNLKDIEGEIKRLIHQAENDISKLDGIQQVKNDMSRQLESEIEELSVPIDPTIEKYDRILESRTNVMKEVKEKLARVEEEHRYLSNQLSAKEREEVGLTERLESTEKSVKNTTRQIQSVRLLIEQYRIEFSSTIQNIESSTALRWAILKLYEKRVLKSMKAGNQFSVDTDLYTNFCHQRDHIESLINVVLHRTAQVQETFKDNYIQLAKENSDWTAFGETLKADLEQKRARIAALEGALGLSRHRFVASTADTRRRLKEAVAAFSQLKAAREEEVAKRLDLIQAQRTEIARLHAVLTVDEKGKVVRRIPHKTANAT